MFRKMHGVFWGWTTVVAITALCSCSSASASTFPPTEVKLIGTSSGWTGRTAWSSTFLRQELPQPKEVRGHVVGDARRGQHTASFIDMRQVSRTGGELDAPPPEGDPAAGGDPEAGGEGGEGPDAKPMDPQQAEQERTAARDTTNNAFKEYADALEKLKKAQMAASQQAGKTHKEVQELKQQETQGAEQVKQQADELEKTVIDTQEKFSADTNAIYNAESQDVKSELAKMKSIAGGEDVVPPPTNEDGPQMDGAPQEGGDADAPPAGAGEGGGEAPEATLETKASPKYDGIALHDAPSSALAHSPRS